MPTRPKSDPTRFSFHIPGIPARFSVVEFSVTESISLPFQLDVRITSKEVIMKIAPAGFVSARAGRVQVTGLCSCQGLVRKSS
jgi:hypothetical protein